MFKGYLQSKLLISFSNIQLYISNNTTVKQNYKSRLCINLKPFSLETSWVKSLHSISHSYEHFPDVRRKSMPVSILKSERQMGIGVLVILFSLWPIS